LLTTFNLPAAAAQYLANAITGFQQVDTAAAAAVARLLVVHHLHIQRAVTQTVEEERSLFDISRHHHQQVTSSSHSSHNNTGYNNIPAQHSSSSAATLFDPPSSSSSQQQQQQQQHREEDLAQNQNQNQNQSPSENQNPIGKQAIVPYPEQRYLAESWGMRCGESYVVLVTPERVVLVHVKSAITSRVLDISAVWSCPAACIDQLFSDSRGDLVS
jgi:hypothetical protein